jgi:zinc protease
MNTVSRRSSLPLAAALLTLAGGTTASVHGQEKPTAGPAAASPAAPAATVDLKAALPTDPALVTGTLPNGLKYIIRKHGNPEGRVSVWLHVSSGSLNESEKTRGIAHYLEHMAFNGSKNFPPGSVVDFFQSLGLQFGRDQNAFTSFEQTTYQLALPDTKLETIDKALLFFSDVGGRLLLRNDEIEMERGIILEEKRTRASAQQRIQDFVFERLAPESTFGRRLPIGTDETIKSVQRPDFEGYYNTFYVASNMTLIVVGDVDPAAVQPRISAAFGDLRTVPKPADLPVGVRAPSAPRAIVATDPEQTQAEVSINRISPSKGPTVTVADMRRDLVELIGTWAFNRRIAAEQAKRKTPYLSASASAQDLANAVSFATITAVGEPGKWKEMLAEAGVELQRARIHGFTEREIADARNALISQAEEGVQREATLPARAMLGRINGAVAAEEAPMSSGQRLDLYRALLPGITPAEVSAAFAANFDPANALFIAELPASGDAPTDAQLLTLGQAAVNVRPDKVAEEARAASLLEKAPTPGTLVEGGLHEATNVLSGWLSNNARFHHRQMDVRKNEASIIITLAGGEIQETAPTRGPPRRRRWRGCGPPPARFRPRRSAT